MPTVHPEITRLGPSDRDRIIEPLAVSPRQACLLLGIGNTRLYELIRDRELVTYREGRARRITMESIHARVARLAFGDDTVPIDRRRAQSRDRSVDTFLMLQPSDSPKSGRS